MTAVYGGAHRKARLLQLERMPWCEDCGAPATVADHDPPISRHEHDPDGCWCRLRSQCVPCSQKQGGELGGESTRMAFVPAVVEYVEPDPIPPDDPRWRVAWLDDLRDVPDNATWPRFATLPHPAAAGSYGTQVEARARRDHGVVLRWWQRLVLRLLLQHDIDGALLFSWAVVSTARQSGKTWLLRELAWWRLHQRALFDDVQHVVHTARTLTPAWDTILPVLLGLIESDTYDVTRAQARYGVLFDDGGWRVISQSNVYGQTASLGLVDEAWGVKPSDITDGFEPIIVERSSGQLALVSTAHRRATSLMPSRRVEAIEQITAPARGLIVEWSTPRHLPLTDRAGWRMASPSWSPAREQLMADSLVRALGGESLDPTEPDPVESFRAQWLNQWPTRSMVVGAGEPLVDIEVWASLAVNSPKTPSGAAVLAVEDYHGNGYGAVLVGEIDAGRMLIRSWTFERRRDLLDWLASVVALPTVLAGVTLATDKDLVRVAPVVERHGTTETALALPLLREMVAADRVRHIDSLTLSEQLKVLRVRSLPTGLHIASRERNDLVRCAAWGVRWIDQGNADPGGIS